MQVFLEGYVYVKEEQFMQLTIREPGSAITHFIAFFLAAIAASPLIMKAHSGLTTLALTVFAASMILLYGASTLYHSVNVTGRILQIFRKIDHMMIFVLIAGSYTPVCLIVLGGTMGYSLLALVWSVAIVGMLVKALWITCPKWFSSILYIAMGWLCLFVFGTLWNTLPHAAFGWLLAGGIIYTIGGVIYALKLSTLNSHHKYFGSHEIFHLFVMGGSICHFIFMYCYIA
jgi:channel protein, hemolysin III family